MISVVPFLRFDQIKKKIYIYIYIYIREPKRRTTMETIVTIGIY